MRWPETVSAYSTAATRAIAATIGTVAWPPGDHIQIRGVEVVVEVDHRYAERTHRGGCQVDDPNAANPQSSPIGVMRGCGGGVEDEFYVGESGKREEPVDTSAVVGTPWCFARASPSESGSMPTRAAIVRGRHRAGS